jgi:probable HAF family extracellular repeat protein
MALAVNDAGTIVGYQGEAPNFPQAAIFVGDGTYSVLGNLGLEESWAEDINEPGVIVGRAFGIVGGDLIQKAFVYEDGQMRDLLSLVPGDSGWEELFEAAAINDTGTIVGTGIFRGEVRAYIATPVPEPSGLALLALFVLSHVRVCKYSAGKDEFGIGTISGSCLRSCSSCLSCQILHPVNPVYFILSILSNRQNQPENIADSSRR